MKALMTLVLVLVLAGCAAGQGDAGRTTAEETTARHAEETTAHKEETTTQKGAGDANRPPDSTLSYGGQEVKGSLGSYCWGNMCADAFFFVPPRKKTLTVPSGSEMVFRYEGQRPPKKVGAEAYPLRKIGTSTASPDPNRSRSLKALGSGVERTIAVELPPGEYLVYVFIQVPKITRGVNDASYHFRVKVE